MSESSLKTIRNGSIASVIGGVVLLSIPVLRGYFVTFSNWIWSLLIRCWKALLESYAVPGWIWLIIGVLAIIGIIAIFSSLRSAPEPEFKSYVTDMIFGAQWRWCWAGNQISDLWCYCPTCDATLVYNDSSCRGLYGSHHTDFICENCGDQVVSKVAGGNKGYAVGAAEREIHRRIRTNEYKKKLELVQ